MPELPSPLDRELVQGLMPLSVASDAFRATVLPMCRKWLLTRDFHRERAMEALFCALRACETLRQVRSGDNAVA